MASTQTAKEERIKYMQGDLFTCPGTDSLAHCISEDCHMSAGIAAVFKKKFGGVQELLNQQKKTGDVAVLKRDDRYVYYLITKSKYFYKPTYDNLRKSLEAMKIHSLKNAVTHISMPKISSRGTSQEQTVVVKSEVTASYSLKKMEFVNFQQIIGSNRYLPWSANHGLLAETDLHMTTSHISSWIGCGLDRLDWNKVSTMLEEIFEDTDVYITVYTL